MNWLRRKVREWLGVDEHGAYLRHLDAQRLNIEVTLESYAKTNHGLAQALQAAVAQLNRNTVMMQRWAKESETLRYIEQRHESKEAHAQNGGRILTLPPGASL